VNAVYATPILRIADTSRLRIRLEIDEPDVACLRVGQGGAFQVRGMEEAEGRLVVKTIIPMFGPKRLFNPDTSARNDTRTIAVLCEPRDDRIPLFLGQRVTAYLGETRPGPRTTR
jgi:HlyD family secretion protein